MVAAIRVATHRNHNSDDSHRDIDIGPKEAEEKNGTAVSHVKVDEVGVEAEVAIVNEGKFCYFLKYER